MGAGFKDVVEKTDIAVANLVASGGYLNPIQSDTFIRMIQEQPTIIHAVRTVPMNSPTMDIDKIGFASRILHKAPAAGTALAPANRSAPTTDKVSLATKEIIAEIHLPYDVLEDNIERGSLESTIMTMISERASLDLEELIITGDKLSADEYLAMYDGILVQATSHVVDYSATRPNITRGVFKEGMKAMPNKYLRNRSSLRFYVSPHAEVEWVDSLANRLTALGDSKIGSFSAQPAYGIPVEAAALMPNYNYILTFPKNIIFGVQRQIMIETDRDIRARVLVVVMTLRVDIKYEEEDAVVKCQGLAPDGTTTTTTG